MSQAAEKVLSVLEYVATCGEPTSAMTAASALGLDKSTCSRSLALLVENGWLVRDERTRLFSVGPTLMGMAATAAVNGQLQAILLPTLAQLRAETGETISFNRRTGDDRVCVAGLESEQIIRQALPIGESFRLSVGPAGKSILAFVEPGRRDALLCELDEVEAEVVRSYLETAVRTGLVSTDDDHFVGIGGLSVPVFDREGIFGSLTVSGPLSRWNRALRAATAPTVLAAGRTLSSTLGGDVERYTRWIDASVLEAKGLAV